MPNPVGARGYWEPGPAPAPQRGLFSVIEVVDNVDPHLLMGAEYMTNRCTAGCVWLHMCEPPQGELKQFMTLNMVWGDPFTVYDALECFPVGVTAAEQASRLQGTFDVKAEAVAEAQLQNLIQSSGYSVIDSSTLVDMVADLEEELAANYAGQGLLHFDRHTALVAASRHILKDPEDVDLPARTINGTPAVLGRGYEQSPGNYWAGATGRVTLLRGPLVITDAPPLGDNRQRVLAEQVMVLLVECVARYAESVIA